MGQKLNKQEPLFLCYTPFKMAHPVDISSILNALTKLSINYGSRGIYMENEYYRHVVVNLLSITYKVMNIKDKIVLSSYVLKDEDYIFLLSIENKKKDLVYKLETFIKELEQC